MKSNLILFKKYQIIIIKEKRKISVYNTDNNIIKELNW